MGGKAHLSSLHLHELLKRKNILVYNCVKVEILT